MSGYGMSTLRGLSLPPSGNSVASGGSVSPLRPRRYRKADLTARGSTERALNSVTLHVGHGGVRTLGDDRATRPGDVGGLVSLVGTGRTHNKSKERADSSSPYSTGQREPLLDYFAFDNASSTLGPAAHEIAGASPCRPNEKRQEHRNDANDEKDVPNGIHIDSTVRVDVDGPGQDCSDGCQDDSDSKAHAGPPFLQ